VQDIVDLGAVAAGNDELFKLLGSRKIAKIATFCPLSPDRNFKFSRMLAIHIIQNSTKCRVNFEPLFSNWGFCKWVGIFLNGATLNSCNLQIRLQIEKLKQMRLTTSLSYHNCQASYTSACSCWERRAVFFRPDMGPKLPQEQHYRDLLSQHSTEVNLIFN